jgi:hypothetical protein
VRRKRMQEKKEEQEEGKLGLRGRRKSRGREN